MADFQASHDQETRFAPMPPVTGGGTAAPSCTCAVRPATAASRPDSTVWVEQPFHG